MRVRQTFVNHAVFAVFLLTLYAGLSNVLAQPVGNVRFTGTTWTLESLNGNPLLPETNITLEFSRWSLGGWDGCNYYGGPYKARLIHFEISPGFGSTMMGCIKSWEQQANRYTNALYEAANYRVVGNRLELLDGANAVILTFARGGETP